MTDQLELDRAEAAARDAHALAAGPKNILVNLQIDETVGDRL